jgi:hypothetical protein
MATPVFLAEGHAQTGERRTVNMVLGHLAGSDAIADNHGVEAAT